MNLNIPARGILRRLRARRRRTGRHRLGPPVPRHAIATPPAPARWAADVTLTDIPAFRVGRYVRAVTR